MAPRVSTHLRRAAALLALGAGALALSGCTPSTAFDNSSVARPIASGWFQSSRGDVWCAYKSYDGTPAAVSCDWRTLTAARTHTTAKSPLLRIDLITTKRGTVQCAIEGDYTGEEQTPSCDWSTLVPLGQSPRL